MRNDPSTGSDPARAGANTRRKPGQPASADPHGIDPLAGAAMIRDQVGVLRDDAARLVDLGKAARVGLEWSLRERLDRSPYAVLASAAGAGAILGGALTPAMVLGVASAALRLGAATAVRGALLQALGSSIARRTNGGANPANRNNDPSGENKP